MISLLVAFFVSLMITFFVVRYDHLHGWATADYDLDGVQKFHPTPVPRVGGAAIMVGLIFSEISKLFLEPEVNHFGFLVLATSLPAFLAGMLEDLTKSVSVAKRLLATALSAILGGLLVDGWLTRLDLPGVDYLMTFSLVAILVTCLAVSGVANAFNLIDGFNGLAGMVAVIILCGLAYVANEVGDHTVMITSLAVVATILGFLVFNYPRGLIFLGDGGAYLVGFLVAELSVLLVVRNPQISPWFPFLLVFYPIFETIFTIYRRMIIGKVNPGLPDAAHLHQLIFHRVILWGLGDNCCKKKTQRNSMTSPYLWLITMTTVIPAMFFWSEPNKLQIAALCFSIFYIWLYRKIYLDKIPKWLVIRQRNVEDVS